MEFDKDGRIILPDSIRKELDKEQESIILTKVQVSKNPSIAQLKITAGKNISNQENLFYEMKRFCDAFVRLNFPGVDKDVSIKNEAIFIEAKGSFQMYSFFGGLVGGMRERFREHYPIVIKGTWGSGDSFV